MKLWPKIVDAETARGAVNQGFWAAVLVAATTTVFATIALVLQKDVASINAWAYLDAIIFGVIAWRIRRFSRAFAVGGVALFVIEKSLMIADSHGPVAWLLLALILLLMFINGARGTFAYHGFITRVATVDPPSEEQTSTR